MSASFPSHETLNFEIPPGQRACFYEDMTPGTPSQVSAFVLAGGDMQIALNVYGPLENGDVLQVNQTHNFFVFHLTLIFSTYSA
ncbi:emp24/gp25L/p24 family protein [archaeon]|nr:MAG: emp24/gp25L/p24 family protein [archaeon]